MIRRDRIGAVLVLAVISLPVVIGFGYSALASVDMAGPGASGFTLQSVLNVGRDATTWRSVAWTLWTSVIATAVAAVLAIEVSIRVPRDRPVVSVLLAPLAVPHVGAALAFLLLLSQGGMLSRIAFAVHLTGTPADFPVMVGDVAGFGFISAAVWKEFPFLLLVALAASAQKIPLSIEAARTLGASPSAIRRRIVRPLLWRAIAPALVAVFAFLLGQYDMATLLAPTQPTALSLLTMERWSNSDLSRRGEAHVLGLIAFAMVAGAVAWQVVVRRHTDATSTAS
jgi:putative spermidine/putrescine transport system permease protein